MSGEDPGSACAESAKGELRAEMRRRRRLVADPMERSTVIWDRVIAIEAVRSAQRVMVFTSILGEPDTAAMVEWCRCAAKETAVPEEEPDPRWPDVVIVPGLAFTADGDRLGQGGGWYDRFLAQRRADCVAIGVGFREQLLESLPTERHDVVLDLVVTDA
jgi:5-formyltetrahydrofolate cyclo-ligase